MYIDPGYGSLVFQVAAALAVSFGAFWLASWEKFRGLFFKKGKNPAEKPEKEERGFSSASSVDEDGFLK